MHRTALGALVAAAGLASANTVTVVTIDLDSSSSISGTISQDAPLVGGSDTFATGLTGFAVFEINETTGEISLVDFMGATTEPVSLEYPGFLSSLTFDATTLTASYAGAGPTAPVPYAGSAFEIMNIPAALTGTANVDASIFGVVNVMEMFDLASFGALDLPSFSGDLVNTGGDAYALTSSFTANQTAPFDTGQGVIINITADITVQLNGTGTGVTMELPKGCSPADFAAPFGTLDISDVVAFLQAFGAQDPSADLATPTGTFDISDVVAFLQLFGAGCP